MRYFSNDIISIVHDILFYFKPAFVNTAFHTARSLCPAYPPTFFVIRNKANDEAGESFRQAENFARFITNSKMAVYQLDTPPFYHSRFLPF